MAKKREPEMKDAAQVLLNRLARIEHKVDSLDQTSAFALRADEQRHQATIKTIFKNGKRRAQVYLAANASRSVAEIAKYLAMKPTNVSRELKKLHDEGLLEVADTDGATTYWGKKPLDRTLRVTRFLCGEYALEKDGRESKKKKR